MELACEIAKRCKLTGCHDGRFNVLCFFHVTDEFRWGSITKANTEGERVQSLEGPDD